MANGGHYLSSVSKAIKDPTIFLNEAERLLAKYIFETKYGDGIDVMARDWDNLLILDACRADFFTEHNEIDGELQTVVSRGSASWEFLTANFAGRELHDTILVTANPFVEKLSDDVFFDVCYAELFERWDDSLKTIPPETVVEATLQKNKQHPDKRLIAHFMQPHAPYVGSTGRELYERYEFGVFNPDMKGNEGFTVPEAGIPQAVEEGPIREEELRQAYAENVQIAIKHAARLVERLNGRSVVTADHGEMLGERELVRKRYGHRDNIYTPELRIVPWLIVESSDRREVIAGEPSEFERLDDDVRESRLQALGYT